jgi:hypothetical protein
VTKPLKSVKLGIPLAAQEFLRFLDPNAVDFGKPFAFQTYDDDKVRNDRMLARTYTGTLEQHAATLADANANGCAVHVTINDCGDKPRRAANVSRVRKHFVEIDGTMTLSEIMALCEQVQLPPAWINESSPSHFHVFWNVADDIAGDLEGFTKRQKKLAKLFKAGRESVDLSRVLRLPGYWHQKGDAFQVRTVYTNPKALELDRFQFFTALSEVETDEDAATFRDAEHEEDQAAIDAATEVFKSYTPAISDTPNGRLGKKGNSTTFDACAIARDKGVEESTCLELADKYYNPRCDPMWGYEQLATIVANVYRYTKNKQGARHPQLVEAERLAEAEADFAPFMDDDLLFAAKEKLRRKAAKKAARARARKLVTPIWEGDRRR